MFVTLKHIDCPTRYYVYSIKKREESEAESVKVTSTAARRSGWQSR